MKWFSVRGHKHSESPHGVIKGHAYAYKDQAEEPTTIGPSIIKDGPQRKHAWLRSTSEVHQGRHLFTSFPRNSPPSLDFISTPVRPFRQFGKPTMHASRVKNAGVLRVRSTFASKEARQHLQIRIPSLFFFYFHPLSALARCTLPFRTAKSGRSILCHCCVWGYCWILYFLLCSINNIPPCQRRLAKVSREFQSVFVSRARLNDLVGGRW